MSLRAGFRGESGKCGKLRLGAWPLALAGPGAGGEDGEDSSAAADVEDDLRPRFDRRGFRKKPTIKIWSPLASANFEIWSEALVPTNRSLGGEHTGGSEAARKASRGGRGGAKRGGRPRPALPLMKSALAMMARCAGAARKGQKNEWEGAAGQLIHKAGDPPRPGSGRLAQRAVGRHRKSIDD